VSARVLLRLLLRLAAAAPALPPAVVWFQTRAVCVAMTRSDVFSLRSATSPRQLAELLRLARDRRSVAELGTATGWTAAAFALADPARRVISCDPFDQTGRERYMRLLRPSVRRRIDLLPVCGTDGAVLREDAIDLLFIDSSHERQQTVDEWRAWRPRLAPGALVVFDDCDHPDFPGVAEAIAELGLQGRRHVGMFVWQAPE
jgi:predicted O-methyltransferase YrrM